MNRVQKILLVENNKQQLKIARSVLTQKGYIVETVLDSKEAVHYLENTEQFPSLIIADVMIPEMNGFELCSLVKEKYPNIPFIILIDHKDDKCLEDAVLYGALDYLEKPISKTELIIRAKNALKIKKLEHDSESNNNSFKGQKEIEVFKKTIENISEGAVITDTNGRMLYANSAIKKMLIDFGEKPEENVFVNIEDYKYLVNSLKSGKDISAEVKMRGKNDKIIDVLIKAYPIKNSSGNMIAFIALHLDITEKKKIEKDLYIFKRVVNESTSGIGIADTGGNKIYENQALKNMLNLSAIDVPIENSYFDKEIKNEIFSNLNSGKNWNGEIRMYGKTGSIVDVLLKAYPILNKENTPEYYVGIHSDISKEKEVQRAFIEQKDFLEGVFNTARVIILVLDNEGKIVRFNPYFEELTGYKIEEMKGKNWFSSFLIAEDYARIRNLFRLAVNNVSTKGAQNPIITKDGRKIDIMWYDTTFRDADGNVQGIIAIGIDITERKKYDLQLKNAHKHAIYMLALASEYKDPETGDHLKRLSDMTRELACELGMDKAEAENLAQDSILHDLGKLGISDKILLKPSKLTNEEFEKVKLHTIIGANIIGEDESFKNAGDIALCHHEKWDGSGYPHGLRKENIPFGARIVAVADVFDALISKRPYKEAWPLDKVINEIKRNSGTQFDPKVVDALLNLYEKGLLEQFKENKQD